MEKNSSENSMNIEWIDINLLKTDNCNPNRMSGKERNALRKNIEKFGFNMPIITDMKYLIADGEQKLDVAKEMGLQKVTVLRKDITENDRKILRQGMNKIRGEHDVVLDGEQFKEILKETDMEELTALIAVDEQDILNSIYRTDNSDVQEKATDEVKKLYSHVVECPKCHHKFKKEEGAQ